MFIELLTYVLKTSLYILVLILTYLAYITFHLVFSFSPFTPTQCMAAMAVFVRQGLLISLSE